MPATLADNLGALPLLPMFFLSLVRLKSCLPLRAACATNMRKYIRIFFGCLSLTSLYKICCRLLMLLFIFISSLALGPELAPDKTRLTRLTRRRNVATSQRRQVLPATLTLLRFASKGKKREKRNLRR